MEERGGIQMATMELEQSSGSRTFKWLRSRRKRDLGLSDQNGSRSSGSFHFVPSTYLCSTARARLLIRTRAYMCACVRVCVRVLYDIEYRSSQARLRSTYSILVHRLFADIGAEIICWGVARTPDNY